MEIGNNTRPLLPTSLVFFWEIQNVNFDYLIYKRLNLNKIFHYNLSHYFVHSSQYFANRTVSICLIKPTVYKTNAKEKYLFSKI